ncbi:MAG: AgmX/PglI C-terminal domain-containing protein, partial [Oligoflexia bacterium]
PGVSPIHAVIELTREGKLDSRVEPAIFDLASETGVKVNGKNVVTQKLSSGDEIEVAGVRIRFLIEEIQSSSMAPVARVEGRALYSQSSVDLGSFLTEPSRPVEEIFDYSVTHRSALEVVMSWQGSILDVAHFVDENEVRIGESRSARFGIPSLLSQANHILITRSQERFTLRLDPKMKGVIQRAGRLESVEQVLNSGGPTLELKKNEFAKLQVGDVVFYLSFTQAPPRLKRGRVVEHDPLFWKTFWGSLAVTLALLIAMMNVKLPQEIEAEELPERIATILYQPEKFSAKLPPEPKSKPVAVEAPSRSAPKPPPARPQVTKIDIKPDPANANRPVPQELTGGSSRVAANRPATQLPRQTRAETRAKEGEGARAAGRQGARGSQQAAPGKTPQELAQRPSPQGGKGVGGAGRSEVKDVGNVDLLKGAGDKILDILGNSAARLGKDGERLKGFGGFTTQGSGGQALSGSGTGGGGNAQSLGVGGLGEKGRGGGRVGTGLGATGDGAGIIGGKTRVLIRSGGPEEAVVLGAVDASAIEAALLAHKDEFRLCYEREINAEKPDLSGRVGTNFVIGAEGKVTQAGIASTSLNHPPTEKCVLTVIRRIDFPKPRGGGVVQVSYPFKFSSGSR